MQLFCPYCMKTISQPEQPCPACGKNTETYIPSSHHLPPGSELKRQYVIGRVLGEGGFGITYLGFDKNLERVVAIKEYFPTAFVKREITVGQDVTCYTDVGKSAYEVGLEKFVQEARIMARLDNIPEIVRVMDYFRENKTAYIVMEYLEGKTLRELTKEGCIPAGVLLELMEPLLRAIQLIHQEGLLHRDISPDNLLQLKSGKIKLMDFGCARDIEGGRTMTVMLKHGYAPLEQYAGHDQGPWTDVYATCATIYYCLTLHLPPQALLRGAGEENELVLPTRLGAALTPDQEQALIRGLAVQPQDRWQSMAELYAAIYSRTLDGHPLAPLKDDRETELLQGKTMRLFESTTAGSRESQETDGNSVRKESPNPEVSGIVWEATPKRFSWKLVAGIGAACIALLVLGLIFLTPKQPDEVNSEKVPAVTAPKKEDKFPVEEDEFPVEGERIAGYSEMEFSDYAEILNIEAVDVVCRLGIIDGIYGTFSPDSILTREQAAKIITYLLLGRDEADALVAGSDPYQDVSRNRWSAGSIAYCKAEGIMSGVGGNKFDIDGTLTGAAFAKMLLVTLGFDANREELMGSDWRENTTRIAQSTGLCKNLPDNILDMDINRSDAAQMTFNALMATMQEYQSFDAKTRRDVPNSPSRDYRIAKDERDEVRQLCEYAFPELKRSAAGEWLIVEDS